MTMLYILMILIAMLPLWKTVRFIQLEERIRKKGISTTGIVTHIHTIRHQRGAATDRVHTRYSSSIPGRHHDANFVTKYNRYRIGQEIPVKYIPEQPDKIVVDQRRGYWPMLIFSTVLLLFVFFAVYKINEMVKADDRTYGFGLPWKNESHEMNSQRTCSLIKAKGLQDRLLPGPGNAAAKTFLAAVERLKFLSEG